MAGGSIRQGGGIGTRGLALDDDPPLSARLLDDADGLSDLPGVTVLSEDLPDADGGGVANPDPRRVTPMLMELLVDWIDLVIESSTDGISAL